MRTHVQIADLVEEQRSARRSVNEPWTLLLSPGEGAWNMSEQGVGEHRFIQAGDVHRNEPTGTIAHLMNRLRQQLFADTALPGYQYRPRAGCYSCHVLEDRSHPITRRDDVGKSLRAIKVLGQHLAPQQTDFLGELSSLHGPSNRRKEATSFEGFHQVVLRTPLHALYRDLHITGRRDHDDRDIRVSPANLAEHLHSGDKGHRYVQSNYGHVSVRQKIEHFPAVRTDQDVGNPRPLEHPLHGFQDERIVIDKQDTG